MAKSALLASAERCNWQSSSNLHSVIFFEQNSDYDKVKQLILKAYELVPEAYRQKFRNCRKENDQTHVDLLEQKNNYLTVVLFKENRF